MKYNVRGRQQLDKLAGIIRALSEEALWIVEIRRDSPKRTLSQNARYWVLVTAIADSTGNSKEDVHLALKTRFLPQQIIKLPGEEIYIPMSSTLLDVPEFSEFLEKCIAYAASELGVVV